MRKRIRTKGERGRGTGDGEEEPEGLERSILKRWRRDTMTRVVTRGLAGVRAVGIYFFFLFPLHICPNVYYQLKKKDMNYFCTNYPI